MAAFIVGLCLLQWQLVRLGLHDTSQYKKFSMPRVIFRHQFCMFQQCRI